MPETEKKHQHLSTFQTARLLGVDMGTVIDWCEQNKLSAFKTPGGHRRIHPDDLVEFLNRYKMPIPSELSRLNRLKCLIVDDDPSIRRVIERAIKSIDPTFEVHQAVDGYEAGAKAFEIFPELVVLDLGLPGINGFKVCQHLRTDVRFKHTKILVITGLGSSEVKERILRAGADEYLPKPFQIQELKQVILDLLEIKEKP